MKVSILGGAGTVGATTAFMLGREGIVEEIRLIDIKENVAKNHEMDLQEAIVTRSDTKIISGGFELLSGSDLVLNCTGVASSSNTSRMDHLQGNLEVLRTMCKMIVQYTDNPIILTATNPMDVLNTMTHRYTGFESDRIIGFSLNDTLRFRLAISRVCQVKLEDVQAYVIGEHGEDQCPVFSQIRIGGERFHVTEEQKVEILKSTKDWLKQFLALKAGRTSGWLSSVNITEMIRVIASDAGEVMPCSVIGSDGVSIGRLAKLGRQGVMELVDLDLDSEEQQQWQFAKDKTASIVASLS